jgi:hypothetical protein
MIAKYFEVSLLTSIRHNAKFSSSAKSYYFSAESPHKLSKEIAYLEKYTLIGLKALDYRDFAFVYQMILAKSILLTRVGKISNQL